MSNLNIISTDKVQSLFESSPTQCSKYESCSVPICPLDSDWRLRDHLRGESSCHYLRLVVKGGSTGEEKSTAAYQAAAELWSEHKDELPTALMRQLERASSLGRKTTPISIDPERAEQAMKRLEKIFGEADRPISRFN